MNWIAMAQMAGILAAASLIGCAAAYCIIKGVHPAWPVGALFLLAIIAAGVLCK